jgi:hypothetical protein
VLLLEIIEAEGRGQIAHIQIFAPFSNQLFAFIFDRISKSAMVKSILYFDFSG